MRNIHLLNAFPIPGLPRGRDGCAALGRRRLPPHPRRGGQGRRARPRVRLGAALRQHRQVGNGRVGVMTLHEDVERLESYFKLIIISKMTFDS